MSNNILEMLRGWVIETLDALPQEGEYVLVVSPEVHLLVERDGPLMVCALPVAADPFFDKYQVTVKCLKTGTLVSDDFTGGQIL